MSLRRLLFFCLFAVTLAAAQNRQSVAVLPSVGTINQLDAELLTDKVREMASKTLPQKSFMLLKLDAIVNRVGAEELFRACKEGVCIGELARKASADYGARCDIFKRGNDLILKFELYNVKEEEIVETFTDYDVKDFRGMLATLEKRLPDAFRKMAEVYKESQEAAAAAAKPEPKPEPYRPPPPKPVPAATPAAAPAFTTSYAERDITGTFVDSRDGKTYKTVKIGTQTWMAENLNYSASGSKYYKNYAENSDIYGRLYNWSQALEACPVGWHLPSDAEWKVLVKYVGKKAGKKLKSTSGWKGGWIKNGNGTDEYGFSALSSVQ